MAETTASPQPSEPPPDPAPRPELRLRPPGAPQFHPAAPPEPEATEQLLEQTPPAPPEPQQQPATSRRAARRRRAADSGIGSEASPGPEPAAKTTTSSSTGSSEPKPPPERAPAFVEPVQLTRDLTELLLTAGESANDRFAPEGTPMFLADRAEAEGIARPAARVISRHTPAGLGGPGNPDLADAVAAGITLVRYAVRQIRLWYEIKRLHAGDATSPANQDTETAA